MELNLKKKKNCHKISHTLCMRLPHNSPNIPNGGGKKLAEEKLAI